MFLHMFLSCAFLLVLGMAGWGVSMALSFRGSDPEPRIARFVLSLLLCWLGLLGGVVAIVLRVFGYIT